MKTVHFKLIKKILLGLFALIISLFIIGYLAFYYLVQTNLDHYKNELVESISKATNKKVTIETFDANWNITNPQFIIKNFSFNLFKSINYLILNFKRNNFLSK